MRAPRTTLAGLTAAGAMIAAAPAGAAPVQSAQSTFTADASKPAVVRAPGAERATFLRGGVSAARLGGGSAPSLAGAALRRYGAGLGVTDASSQLKLRAVSTGRTGTRTARFVQTVKGVPVFASGVNVALGRPGQGLRAIAATFKPGAAKVATTTPTVAKAAAEATAAAKMGASKALAPTTLVVYAPKDATPTLAWAVDRLSADGARHDVLMVDATTGTVAATLDRIADAKDRSVYDMKGSSSEFALPGTLVRSEGGASNGDADADDAYNGVGATYDYYEATFGRDSYDGAGAELRSSVNFGRNYQNAFWNGEQMVYGDGFAALDVTAHELTHAVTERTAGLEYQDQSGALNESLSDMAAWDVDPGDSTIGEDIPIGAIRDMRDPGAFDQPATAGEYVCTSADNGGVHTNSGIPNKVYANLVDSLGRSGAEQVRYAAQTQYLTPSASFADAREAFVSAAGDAGVDAGAVAAAWDAQGVTAGWSPGC